MSTDTPTPKITACLITWKRQQNIPRIIESLLQYPFIDEIIIHDNSKTDNLINYARYTSARRAQNGVIYVQDDDHIIKNVGDLYDQFLLHPDKIINGGIPEYLACTKDNTYGASQMAIVGWGTIFARHLFPQPLKLYTDKFGEDYCFYRETDRIFTMLANQHHVMVPVDVEVLPGARDEQALSSQNDHIKYKNLAIERCREILGI